MMPGVPPALQANPPYVHGPAAVPVQRFGANPGEFVQARVSAARPGSGQGNGQCSDGPVTTDLRARLKDVRPYVCTDARRSRGDLPRLLELKGGMSQDVPADTCEARGSLLAPEPGVRTGALIGGQHRRPGRAGPSLSRPKVE